MAEPLTLDWYENEFDESCSVGGVVSWSWYQHIKYTNKRGTYADHLAVRILADIVHRYQPIEVRDKVTGETRGWAPKFQGDALCRSYEAYAAQFGASFNQVKASFALLKKLGLIKLEFRHFRTGDSVGSNPAGNVMYIVPVVDAIAKITYEIDREAIESARTKPRHRTNPPASLKRYRDSVLADESAQCWYCGCRATAIDHVKPLILGGTHDRDNLVPACHSCNSSKGRKMLEEYRASVARKNGTSSHVFHGEASGVQ